MLTKSDLFAPNQSDVLALIAAAVAAPSADNRHHVLFEVRTDGMVVRTDAAFLQAQPRHRRLLTLVSYGSVIENLRLALTERGWSFTPSYFPDPADPGCILAIEWAALAPCAAPDPLASRIATRHTNRRFYGGPSCSPGELTALQAAAGSTDGVRLRWADEPALRKSLLRLMRLAETERFRSRVLHAELFEAIAFDVGWRRPAVEGLAPGSLEVEAPMRGIFGLLRFWPVMRAARLLGVHAVLGLRAGELPARSARHLGVLTSRLPADTAALTVGVAFQRLWLAADAAGLALQPMVSAAILTAQQTAADGASDATRHSLARGWREIIGDDIPWIVFRLGHARTPRFRSVRKPPESYLL